MMRIKTGDTVIIRIGKDKGKKGKVIRVLPREGRIVVEGTNMHKKHVRARRAGEKGQVATIPLPFSVANASLLCPHCGKAAKVGYRKEGTRKYRVCKKCKGEI